jgi:uncharacterized membrane protein
VDARNTAVPAPPPAAAEGTAPADLTGPRARAPMASAPPSARHGARPLKAWLAYLWYRITAGLWVVPALMSFSAVVLAIVTLTVDYAVGLPRLARVGGVFAAGPEGARAVLAAIAGSMVTVASLVFSMTLVTLQLASSQLGPRLIARFMRDRINQVVLGTFIATFLYALLVLQTVTESGAQAFVPNLSVTVALALTLLSLGWLVYFIHHVADSIQADTVIAQVAADLMHALDRLYPRLAAHDRAVAATAPVPVGVLAEPAVPVPAARGGYVQAIDTEALLRLARQHDLVIEILRRPGHFVIVGRPLMRAWPAARVREEVIEAAADKVVLGPKRTPTQDLEFSIDALVEIALRALSPGINDPRTAMTCIDRLAEALAHFMRTGSGPPLIHDADGALRLIMHPTTFDGAIDASFNQIRQAATGQVAVLIRLIGALGDLAESTVATEQRNAVARHADMVRRACRRSIVEPEDRTDVERELRSLDAAIAAASEAEAGRPPSSA